ncbi:MAG: YceI family protein [Acidimicrobiales bacterium]
MTTIESTHLPLRSGTWAIDTIHSTVEFTVRHLGISKVRGRFNSFEGAASIGAALDDVAITASIDLASVDTNNPDRDGHLRSADFFDADKNPRMDFLSNSVSQNADGEFVLTGDLTLNGVTNPISLDVEFHGAQLYPMDEHIHAGFTATGAISRKAYGVDFDIPLGADKMAIGDKVAIELEIQLVEPS